MRDESQRWGLGMGVVAAVLGTLALILGSLVEPVQRVTTAEAAALAIFIRGIFVLVTLGVALGLAYYAGLRAERARLMDNAAQAAQQPVAGAADQRNSRAVAVVAGGLTMFCYWLITSLYMFVLPSSTQPSTAKLDVLSFVENRLLFGIIFVLFGLGLGGLGGRAPAARLLLDRIVKSPAPAMALAVPGSASIAIPPEAISATDSAPDPSAPAEAAREAEAAPRDTSGAADGDA